MRKYIYEPIPRIPPHPRRFPSCCVQALCVDFHASRSGRSTPEKAEGTGTGRLEGGGRGRASEAGGAQHADVGRGAWGVRVGARVRVTVRVGVEVKM